MNVAGIKWGLYTRVKVFSYVTISLHIYTYILIGGINRQWKNRTFIRTLISASDTMFYNSCNRIRIPSWIPSGYTYIDLLMLCLPTKVAGEPIKAFYYLIILLLCLDVYWNLLRHSVHLKMWFELDIYIITPLADQGRKMTLYTVTYIQ